MPEPTSSPESTSKPKPAFIPKPAKLEKPLQAASGLRIPFTPKRPTSTRKKALIIFTCIFVLLMIMVFVASMPKKPPPPPQVTTATPTLTPTPPMATIAPTVSPTTIPVGQVIPTPVIDIIRAGWQSYTNQQGGYTFSYPDQLTIKPSTDFYFENLPAIYEDSYYFDCINRQLGSSNPYACWLIDIEFTLGDLDTLLIGPPEYNQLPSLNSTEMTSYTDKQGRTWTIRGPEASLGNSILYAQLAHNQVVYQLKTQAITRSMQYYLRNNPSRPFGFQLQTRATPQDANQFHQLLVNEMLSSFKTFRKPLIQEPKWLQVRVSPNWSVAYPENWKLYRPEEIQLLENDEGLLEGWYGNKDSVSFHKYSVRLTTPDISQYPASALSSVDAWKDYFLSQLSPEQSDQVETEVIGRKNIKEFHGYYLFNMPDQSNFYSDSALPDIPVHQVIIWNTETLPRRIITIKQIDGLYEPDRMQALLERFFKLIFE